MAFDVKKEYKDLYQPAATPSIIEVPRMRFSRSKAPATPTRRTATTRRRCNCCTASRSPSR